MSETPEERNELPQSPPEASRNKAIRIVAVIAVIATVATVGIVTGLFTPTSADGDTPVAGARSNSAPEIAELTPSTDRIAPLDTISVSCAATDLDGDGLVYTWSASGGDILGNGPEVEWRAPNIEGLYHVSVTVTDARGGEAQQSVTLRVRVNNSPEILIMESGVGEDIAWVVPGASVYVRCEAEDLDGDTLTYTWSATAGDIFGTGPAVIWVAPDQLGLHWITVAVEDAYGGREERSLPLTVNMAQPPAILGFTLEALDTDQFRPYGDSWRIFKECSCAISARVVDPDAAYRYEWSAERGTLTAVGPNAVWKAPASPKGWVLIVLNVSDAHGNQSSASVRIYVETCPTCMNA